MLSKLQKKRNNNEGFTIIEVMIVLAIAGLILLIVFLAVPALQRSSRNTQRKSDIGRIGSAAETVLSNNDNTVADLTGGTTGTLPAELGTGLSYYTTPTTQVTVAVGPTAVTNNTTINSVVVYTGAVCGALTTGGQGGIKSATAAPTALAIVYSTESGSGTDKVCVAE